MRGRRCNGWVSKLLCGITALVAGGRTVFGAIVGTGQGHIGYDCYILFLGHLVVVVCCHARFLPSGQSC